MKIEAISISRYNGGVKAKRQYGSSTITTFSVGIVGDNDSYRKIEVGGLTPGDRKTSAINKFKEMNGIM
jgi:hypothetical protein